MPCSAVTLSIATITAIVAAALMAIAFSTDNWLYIEVKRSNIQSYAAENPAGNSQSILDSLNNKYYFYTRTRGLFRVCYPKERPPTGEHHHHHQPVAVHPGQPQQQVLLLHADARPLPRLLPEGAPAHSLNNKYYFYTRTRGLFRVCYPKERPPTGEHHHHHQPVAVHPGQPQQQVLLLHADARPLPRLLPEGAPAHSLNNKYYFYTRTRGLFRVCYPKERPPTGEHHHHHQPVAVHPGQPQQQVLLLHADARPLPRLLPEGAPAHR
ncbi:unnamed protein product [Plutella xylostella]|uniref:(diamondback moth) hypothetical protein n=1 Tax=Plutella xylostella TaxID=51655 RepID=A0A8S4D9D0_PLUXY|nr:unnamed protein product [Plutella xylostella]